MNEAEEFLMAFLLTINVRSRDAGFPGVDDWAAPELRRIIAPPRRDAQGLEATPRWDWLGSGQLSDRI
jgi:hypothetical protein